MEARKLNKLNKYHKFKRNHHVGMKLKNSSNREKKDVLEWMRLSGIVLSGKIITEIWE
jgi:hypothetical protein